VTTTERDWATPFLKVAFTATGVYVLAIFGAVSGPIPERVGLAVTAVAWAVVMVASLIVIVSVPPVMGIEWGTDD
jgi:hypothetical protein